MAVKSSILFNHQCVYFSEAQVPWTWTAGSNLTDAHNLAPVKGVESAANIPAGRYYHASWLTSDGSLYIFGGYTNQFDSGNDLWKLNPTTNAWTWLRGNLTAGDFAVPYPTLGVVRLLLSFLRPPFDK